MAAPSSCSSRVPEVLTTLHVSNPRPFRSPFSSADIRCRQVTVAAGRTSPIDARARKGSQAGLGSPARCTGHEGARAARYSTCTQGKSPPVFLLPKFCTSALMACALLCCVCAQGPKPKPCDTGGKKRWNKAAPLSKKNKGIGRGKKGAWCSFYP